MDNKYLSLFSGADGERIYSAIETTIRDYGMDRYLKSGVLIGLSGGADSVMLTLALLEYRRRNGFEFAIAVAHVNHMIRGDEAVRDQEFSRSLAEQLGIEFISVRIDVPRMAREMSRGVEEIAREVRYSAFADIISGRKDLSTIAVAHNAGDNAETVIFNIARGTGLAGAAGIPPIRDNIVRPLLGVTKKDISSLLNAADIEYVTDSTNESTDYTRNYIRHEIMPRLQHLNPRCESAITSFAYSARETLDYLDAEADKILAKEVDKTLPKSALTQLPPPLFARVLIRFAALSGITSLERTHLVAISKLISGDNFRLSVPSCKDFICERGICFFAESASTPPELYQRLSDGLNPLSGYSAAVYIGDNSKSFINVYKTAIQADISSAIIVGDLYCRFKLDGDAYYYGGMTRKLKKLFNDRGIPPTKRSRIPVICDDNGIVWVPGLGVREDLPKEARGQKRYISLLLPINECGEKIYIAVQENTTENKKGLDAR